MANETLLAAVKLSLGGIRHNALDDDIQEVIGACKLDLKTAGVRIVDESDALIRQAVKLYSRSYFNYQGEGVRYGAAYAALKDSLAMCGDYNAPSNQ